MHRKWMKLAFGIYVLVSFVLILKISRTESNEEVTQVDSVSHTTKLKRINILQELNNSKDLLEFIYRMNRGQHIFNQNLGDSIDLVIVVQVHTRRFYLEKLIESLEVVPFINTTLIIFSEDTIDVELLTVVQQIEFAKVMQIFYPFSIQTHPNQFPGSDSKDCKSKHEYKLRQCPNKYFIDTYGNPRNATLAQIKHHWWWKANFVFDRIRALDEYQGLFLFLEDDHYLAPDFLHCLKTMTRFAKHVCSDCWFFALGMHNRFNYVAFHNYVHIRNSVENLGLAFNRTVWKQVATFSEQFCRYDDYNWDWSLRHVTKSLKPLTMVLSASRVYHNGACGAHNSAANCSTTLGIRNFTQMQTNLFPEWFFEIHRDVEDSFIENGGWGDPRDHALCLGMSHL